MNGFADSRPGNPVLLDGASLADKIREEMQYEVQEFETEFGRPPGLAMLVLGSDRRAIEYADRAKKEAYKIGMQFGAYLWPSDTGDRELQFLIRELNSHIQYDGISVQTPLPPHLNFEEMVVMIDPAKDVEGQHPLNVGRLFSNLDAMVPPPAAGGLELLLRYNVPLTGKHAVVVGRSRIIGKPIADLLTLADATVTVCHSQTQDLKHYLKDADIVVACAGVPGLIHGDMLKPGAAVLDFGMNRDDEDRMVGDVDWVSTYPLAGAISPTPGGTDPMTIMALLANTIKAARRLNLN